MPLQVGKTYLTRDGLAVEIISQHEVSGPYAMLDKTVEDEVLMYFDPSGRHGEEETLTDLVREAGVEQVQKPAKPQSMMALLSQITQSDEDQTQCSSN